MSDRDEFELWAVSRFGFLELNPNSVLTRERYSGDYLNHFVMGAWEGWQAARRWRPIGEAPKDGTEILGYRDDCGPLIIRWVCCYDFMTDTECEESGLSDEELSEDDWFYADFVEGGRLDGDQAPTHWMPLLEPPNE